MNNVKNVSYFHGYKDFCRYCHNTNMKNLANTQITIGNVTKPLKPVKTVGYVPKNYATLRDINQTTGYHLRWMLQKDLLGQDIFLIGPPGSLKRTLTMKYLELTQQEVEYVALSRDTTDSDLKQRREITNGTALYVDQSVVNAARFGRVLVLDGIEKAERNVLPVLNNLLENREMHLDDGRLLIPASRFDALLEVNGANKLDEWKLVRVSEKFRVIALGLPIPRFSGNALDPPLRSRFQARCVNHLSYQETLEELWKVGNVDFMIVEKLVNVAFGLLEMDNNPESVRSKKWPIYPVHHLHALTRISNDSQSNALGLFYKSYPYRLFLDHHGINAVEGLLNKFGIEPVNHPITSQQISSIKNYNFIPTNYQTIVIDDVKRTVKHADVCLVGPKGCGKTILIEEIADGQKVETVMLYQDMTSRDLIQQRVTLDNGDTVWMNSPLIEAAIDGNLVVLDGIHRVHGSTLNILQRLIYDRDIQLYDGSRLLRADRYNALLKTYKPIELQNLKIFKVHENFKMIAIAENDLSNSNNWLNDEVLSMFLFVEIRALDKSEEMEIIRGKFAGEINENVRKIINLSHNLRNNDSLIYLKQSLSTRKLIHIAEKFAKYPYLDPFDVLERVFLIKFLPNVVKQTLVAEMHKVGIEPHLKVIDDVSYKIDGDYLTIGKTTVKVYETNEFVAKVPNILFYDVPQHVRLLEHLLQDLQLGFHLLLIGNQGVGKNKLADRLLQLLNRPREYIQLHRDTTVQTLTIQPTVINGVLHFDDSPLVKAVKNGHVLVVDEADKAPTHVTSILKSLVESGEMKLSDGRRIVRNFTNQLNEIKVHKDFRMIVLANRPGFPFLGNDFFGALGDLFSCYAVDNPSLDAEMELLKRYAPSLPVEPLQKLLDIFGELRQLSDDGIVSYPYSTREVVNVAKHLEKFPDDSIIDAMLNVFDFDRFGDDVVFDVLEHHGFKNVMQMINKKKNVQITLESHSGKETSTPKHGKEDPNNDPHVGGNTWAGGTGGRDTAGLGGKGGPYRLDKGHTVHQLSDAEKNDIPEHVKEAARQMNRKAFQDRLKEIQMSEYDANLYAQFYKPVKQSIKSLRVVLESLQAKSKERLWSRNQTSGELDDGKLIESITGEKTIYRKRVDQDPDGNLQKPKRLRLVVDVSGSMYRFNSYDERLDRELEACVLVMEAFQGFDERIKYDIVGHSGEETNIRFVDVDHYPANEKERLDTLRKMHAHSQFCWSGDHTLDAAKHAIDTLSDEDSDESIVIVLSDANLRRYGIQPAHLGKVLTSNAKVSANVIFIGSIGEEAARIIKEMPTGKAFFCENTSELPMIIKKIFSGSLSDTLRSNLS